MKLIERLKGKFISNQYFIGFYNNTIYIANYNNINEFDDKKVVIDFVNFKIIITGYNLRICRKNNLELEIKGLLNKFEVIND